LGAEIANFNKLKEELESIKESAEEGKETEFDNNH